MNTMQQQFGHDDGHVYRIERDIIDLPPSLGPRLDRAWVYTDKAGHTHGRHAALLVVNVRMRVSPGLHLLDKARLTVGGVCVRSVGRPSPTPTP